MKLIGLMPVRNEDWCLGLTARAALQWCDDLVIWLHACHDQSEDIAFDLSVSDRRAHPLIHTNPVWHEMEHRQQMLNYARNCGATHIATIDADEMVSANLLVHRDSADCACIRCCVKAVSPGEIFALPWLAIRKYRMPSLEAGRVYGEFGYLNDSIDAYTTLAFEDSPRFHWASEVRDGYDFHRRHPFYKGGKDFFRGGLTKDEGGVMHLQFLSDRRLRAKQALYQMTEVLRWPSRAFGVTYNSQAEANAALAKGYGKTTYRPFNAPTLPCPDSWWAPYADLMKYLNIDGVPWQEIECKKLWAEHGPEKFKGLDLFGVVS